MIKKKIEKIVKKNIFINKVYSKLGSIMIRIIFFSLKRGKKQILFVSYMGKSISDSPLEIYNYIVSNNLLLDYELIWAVEDERLSKSIKLIRNTTFVKVDSLNYFVKAIEAKYWVTNVNVERGLKFKSSKTKYLNTWHGIPLKYIGNDVVGRSDYDFSSIDMFLASSKYEREIYSRAFNISDENLYQLGLPRNEVLWKRLESTESFESVLGSYKLDPTKKNLLYAPTWRDISEERKYEFIDFSRSKYIKENYNILVKLHHNSVNKSLLNGEVIDLSDFNDTNILLGEVDLLVTDYSSIAVDFSILERPIILYLNDLEEYGLTRGLYLDLREVSLCYGTSSDAIFDIIEKNKDEEMAIKTLDFKNKFFESSIHRNSTSTVVREFFKEDLDESTSNY